MKYFKDDGKQSISGKNAQEITLTSALKEIENLPDSNQYDSFIGFVNGDNQTVQFTRNSRDDWFIDHPVLENGKFMHSLQDNGLTTNKVQEVVSKFFAGDDWKPLCNLRMLKRQTPEEQKEALNKMTTDQAAKLLKSMTDTPEKKELMRRVLEKAKKRKEEEARTQQNV